MGDQSSNQGSEIYHLHGVLAVVGELARKAGGGDYLYRGEPECYPQVSSSLYRKFRESDTDYFDIETIQREILEEARRFAKQLGEDDEILDLLQHYGYPTNLLDFTTDYNIALFFACDGQPQEDGRVILLSRSSYPSRDPQSPENRVLAQKSVFVQPPKGYIQEYDSVVIPSELKGPILDYLRTGHGLAATTLYNDIHGFMKFRRIHESAYAEFYAGVARMNQEEYDKAIDRFSEAIRFNPNHWESYGKRGACYKEKGDYDRAIQDYDKSLDLNCCYSDAYAQRGAVYWRMGEFERAHRDYDRALELPWLSDIGIVHFNRGMSWLRLSDGEKARKDFSFAQAYGVDIVSEFSDNFTNVTAFEQRHNVQLAPDIAAMLAPR